MISSVKYILLALFLGVSAANAAKVPEQTSLKDSMILYAYLQAYKLDTILAKPEVRQNKKDFVNHVGLLYNNRYKRGCYVDSLLVVLGLSPDELEKGTFKEKDLPPYVSMLFAFITQTFVSEMMFERYAYNSTTKANAFTALQIYLSDEYGKDDIDTYIDECKRLIGNKRKETVEGPDSIYFQF